MSETREPGEPQNPGKKPESDISLPSWVDDAIARSRTRGGAEPDSEAGPAAEMAVSPPQTAEAGAAAEAAPDAPASEPSVVVAHSPREARRRAMMPWLALALIFAAAALVVGYILFTRPPQQ